MSLNLYVFLGFLFDFFFFAMFVFFLFWLIFILSNILLLLLMLLCRRKDINVMDLDRHRSREDLRRLRVEGTIIRIYCIF